MTSEWGVLSTIRQYQTVCQGKPLYVLHPMECGRELPKDFIVTPEQPRLQPSILLIEDNQDDVFLIRREFQRARLTNPLHVVRSGQQAIAYLTRSGTEIPALVLLDINMPGSDGFAVLKWIRRQSAFAQLRVVVLSSLDDTRDANLAHHLGADSFLVKPLESTTLCELWEAVVSKLVT